MAESTVKAPLALAFDAYNSAFVAYRDAIRKDAAEQAAKRAPTLAGITLKDVQASLEALGSVIPLLDGQDGFKAQHSGLLAASAIIGRVESMLKAPAQEAAKPAGPVNPFTAKPSGPDHTGNGTTTRVEPVTPGHLTDAEVQARETWWQEHIAKNFINPWKLDHLRAVRDAALISAPMPVYVAPDGKPEWSQDKRVHAEKRVYAKFNGGTPPAAVAVEDDGN